MTTPAREANELADLLGPFWSPGRVSAALGLPETALLSAQQTGSLLGLVTVDGETVYPTFQFRRSRTGDVEVRRAVAAMLRTLVGHDPWAVAVFMHTPTPELDGQTPLDAARAGAPVETLADLGRVVAREWAAGAA